MILFFSIFFTLYAAINYYIFIRGWQALAGLPHFRIFYLIIFLIAALSYIIAKFMVSYLPAVIYDIILWIGSFWFAFMLYFFLSIVFLDFIRILNWQFDFFPPSIKDNYEQAKQIIAFSVFFIASIIILFGFINTRNFKVKTLNIELTKGACKINELNAVLVTDIHLSPMDNEVFLSKIVKKVNELNPDIIFLAGDIVDDKAAVLHRNNIGSSL